MDAITHSLPDSTVHLNYAYHLGWVKVRCDCNMNSALTKRALQKVYEQMLVEAERTAGLKQSQIKARVVEVACKIVHTLGVVVKIQGELQGQLMDVRLCKIMSRMRSWFPYSLVQWTLMHSLLEEFGRRGDTCCTSYKNAREWVAGW